MWSSRGAAAVGDKPGVTKSLDFYRIGSKSRCVRARRLCAHVS